MFEDLDPEQSPLLKHLEKKTSRGEELTEEDFMEPLEPFPEFKRKMEREFDEITEQFKRLSIENPEQEIIEDSDDVGNNNVEKTDLSYMSQISIINDESEVTYADACKESFKSFTSSLLLHSLSFLCTEFMGTL